MTLINILVIVLILSASVLCIFLIIYIKKIFEQIEMISKDIHHLTENTIPVLRNLDEITLRANRVVADVEGYWIEINHSIKTLREKISNSGSWKIFFGSPAQFPGTVKNIGAIAKGAFAFWRKYKNG